MRWLPVQWKQMYLSGLCLCVLALTGCGQMDSASKADSPAVTQANASDAAKPSQDSARQNAQQNKQQEESHMVRVRVYNEEGKLSEPVDLPKVELTREQWKEKLTPAQFKILRAQGTEAAFCGGLLNNKEVGVYACAGCHLPLFETKTKFESGTGWPSFFEPVASENITEIRDTSYGMVRVEIQCARCGGHLGHVFEDGPRPTGLRYCTNSDALTFVAKTDIKQLAEKIPTESKGASDLPHRQPPIVVKTALRR